MEDLVETDPQLRHREVLVEAEHPLLGPRRWSTCPVRLSESPTRFNATWPLFGQDNSYVLGKVLGLSGEEIADLEDSDVLWPKGLPRELEVGRPLW
jgi:CoA:oxalate CoA-transferase